MAEPVLTDKKISAIPLPGMGNPAYAAGHRNGLAAGQRERDVEVLELSLEIVRLRAVLRKIVDVTEPWESAGEYARDALEGTDG